MSEKRLCVVDSCDYCPFFEKLEFTEKTKNNFIINRDFYKCNKTKLCVEADKISVKQPMKILFSFCTLPSESGDVENMSEKQFVLYEHKGDYYILKNPRLDLDFIEMLGDAMTSEEIVEELNQLDDKVVELSEENKYLKKRIKVISDELYCKDRKLEELGVPIECCDKK